MGYVVDRVDMGTVNTLAHEIQGKLRQMGLLDESWVLIVRRTSDVRTQFYLLAISVGPNRQVDSEGEPLFRYIISNAGNTVRECHRTLRGYAAAVYAIDDAQRLGIALTR